MPTRITAANIVPGSITADRLAEGAGGGPKITNIQVTDDAYAVLDDTAVSLSGGYVKITGTGFQTGCVAIIGTTTATATAFVSSNFINVQVPALAAGTYIVYVVNPDGGVAIRVNGLTYSATPTWITGSTLSEIGVDDQISIQLSASSNSTVTYGLEAGSTLPPGLSLSAQGLLTGSVTGLEADTIYSFTVVAQDAENQDSPRSFSITVGVGDPYFYLTTLLLNGDGTNAAQNNTFLDSSTNNFTVTRSGNTTQGSFSPFSQSEGRWSAYFDGNGDYLNASYLSSNFATSDFTLEAWVYNTVRTDYNVILDTRSGATTDTFVFGITPSGYLYYYPGTEYNTSASGTTVPLNTWTHVAVSRSGTTIKIFQDGVEKLSRTDGSNLTGTSTNLITIGRAVQGVGHFFGYMSNFRIVKGTAIYTSNFTPSTSPLTAISGTSLLACQSNRFRDNSSNNFAITVNGDVSVQPVSPFKATAKYLPVVNGGSGYFDGTTDDLRITYTSALAAGTAAYSFEVWVYFTGTGAEQGVIGTTSDGFAGFERSGGTWAYYNGAAAANTGVSCVLRQWNHVVICRNSSGNGAFFVNGTRLATFTDTANKANFGNLQIGYNGVAGGRYTTGYITDYRYVKGSNPYNPLSTTLTVPNAPLTATAETMVLLSSTNAAIFDATGRNNLETVGNAQISTSVKKYGTGSMYFDGSTSNLVAPYSPKYSLGTGDFTIEGWFYFLNRESTLRSLVMLGDGANGSGPVTHSWGLTYWGTEGSYQIIFTRYDGTNNLTYATVGATILNNQWYHIAVSRSSGVMKIFVNGVAYYNNTVTQSFAALNTMPLRVGLAYYGPQEGYGGPRYWNGYIDDLRITQGFARYTANFTPPASAHRLR